jgi:hypothetical protein
MHDGQEPKDRRFAPGWPSLAPPRWPGQVPEWPLGQQLPQRRGERLTAAETLQRRNLALRGLSARRLRSILRPWFGSAWERPRVRYSPQDVLYALDHLPGGERHEFAGRVRDPGAWLEHRLSFWLDADGEPVPPRSAQLAAIVAERRAEVTRDRDARAAQSASRSRNPEARAAEARNWLYAKLGRPLAGHLGAADSAGITAAAAAESAEG